jgi:hypothetical protein
VPAGQLNRANALSQAVKHGIATIGPVAGGALVATAGLGWGISWFTERRSVWHGVDLGERWTCARRRRVSGQ